MASLKVIAGDYRSGDARIVSDYIHFPNDRREPLDSITAVSVTSEEQVKKFFGAVGLGAVGALALGPLGAVAGLLAGGNNKEVTFIVEFYHGKKVLAKADSKVFEKIFAAAFKQRKNR